MPTERAINTSTATAGFHSLLTMSAMSEATRPITDPMDRSIPPVMITNVTPMPMMA